MATEHQIPSNVCPGKVVHVIFHNKFGDIQILVSRYRPQILVLPEANIPKSCDLSNYDIPGYKYIQSKVSECDTITRDRILILCDD